jgi:hypothetical protein
MRSTIPLDEMRERVGRALYADDLINDLPKEDWALYNNHGPVRTTKRRADRSIIYHVNKCPRLLRPELDRVLGRVARWDLQNNTIDSWLDDNGLLYDPRGPIDRRRFNEAVSKITRPSADPPRRGRGRPDQVAIRVETDMREAIGTGRIDTQTLKDMPRKRLLGEFKCSWETAKKVRERVLEFPTNSGEKQFPTSANV